MLCPPSETAGFWGQHSFPVEHSILCHTTLWTLASRLSPHPSYFLVAPFYPVSPSHYSHSHTAIATTPHPVATMIGFWFLLREQTYKLTMLSMSTESKRGRPLKDRRDCFSKPTIPKVDFNFSHRACLNADYCGPVESQTLWAYTV